MKAIFYQRLLSERRREEREDLLMQERPLAKESCGSVAGSPERIETYRKRVEAGERLFHPNDNRELMPQRRRGEGLRLGA